MLEYVGSLQPIPRLPNLRDFHSRPFGLRRMSSEMDGKGWDSENQNAQNANLNTSFTFLTKIQHISAHLNIPFPNSARHFGHRWFEAFRFLTFAKCVVPCGIIWCPSVNVCSIFDISHDNISSRVDASQRPYGRPQKVLTSSWVSYAWATAAPSASIWLSQSRFSMQYIYTYVYTYMCIKHSTAQGGGRSFKETKPIGEVCCVDAWMAERTHWWTERWLRLWVSLSISLCLYLSICLSVCLSICPSIYLSISISLSLYLSICPFIYLSCSIDLSSYLYLSICVSTYLSTYLPTYLPISLSIYL